MYYCSNDYVENPLDASGSTNGTGNDDELVPPFFDISASAAYNYLPPVKQNLHVHQHHDLVARPYALNSSRKLYSTYSQTKAQDFKHAQLPFNVCPLPVSVTTTTKQSYNEIVPAAAIKVSSPKASPQQLMPINDKEVSESKKRTVREDDFNALFQSVQQLRFENEELKAQVCRLEDKMVRTQITLFKTEKLLKQSEDMKEQLSVLVASIPNEEMNQWFEHAEPEDQIMNM